MFKLVDNYFALLFSFNGLLDHWLYSRQTIFWTSLWRNRNKILKKRKSKVSLEKNLPEEFVEWLHIKTFVINNLQDSSFLCVSIFFDKQNGKFRI